MRGYLWRLCVAWCVGMALLCVGGGVGIVYAQTAQPAPLTQWVTDPQHVLSPEEALTLTQHLQALAQSLPGNPQIAIDLPAHVEDIDSYAHDVLHATGLGRTAVDNGVLSVLAVAQRQARSEAG